MVSIAWCLKQKDGIELIGPSDNLYDSYLKEATETLEQLLNTKGKWQVIMAYYACYNALYALLQKAGIKCEIHDCTIKLIEIIPGFSKEDMLFLQNLKQQRIQAQYYLKKEALQDAHLIKQFILKAKEIGRSLPVADIRQRIANEKK